MKRIAIFASGNGTNAENICKYFHKSDSIEVSLLCTNKKEAFVLNRVSPYKTPTFLFSKSEMNTTDVLENKLSELSIDLIVLAGFLLKIPEKFIKNYENKIINVHPSLLPKYGGRGMYGENIHKAVLKNNETETGVSFHYVNSNYDEGGIIHQERCGIEEGETLESLSDKIYSLEQRFFPKIIEKVIKKQLI
jgi:phosphoribosylglycinamide formyltransferase 1